MPLANPSGGRRAELAGWAWPTPTSNRPSSGDRHGGKQRLVSLSPTAAPVLEVLVG